MTKGHKMSNTLKQVEILEAFTEIAGLRTRNFESKRSTLEQMQEIVDGLIQPVYLTETLTMWVNEEGKIVGLPINLGATKIWNHFYGNTDIIAGDVFFTAGVDEEGNDLEITDEDKAFISGLIS